MAFSLINLEIQLYRVFFERDFRPLQISLLLWRPYFGLSGLLSWPPYSDLFGFSVEMKIVPSFSRAGFSTSSDRPSLVASSLVWPSYFGLSGLLLWPPHFGLFSLLSWPPYFGLSSLLSWPPYFGHVGHHFDNELPWVLSQLELSLLSGIPALQSYRTL